MKMKLLKSVIFIVIGAALFFNVQEVLIPYSSYEYTKQTIDGIAVLDEDSVDVLFMGTSQTHHSISPIKIYNDTGICAYNLATPDQQIEQSYFLLKDALTKQTPSIVVLDIGNLFARESRDYNSVWRYVLDSLDFSETKLKLAEVYGEKWYGDGIMSVFFPVIKYHTRWGTLTAADFLPKQNLGYYSLGAAITPVIAGNSSSTVEEINSVSRILQEDSRIKYINNGLLGSEAIIEPLYVPYISDNNLEYFLKIKNLCEEHHVQLLLMKNPVLQYPQYYGNPWTKQRSEIVRNIAQEYDIPFFDMLYDADIGIDWSTDTCDGGAHLNIRGMDKVTAAMETYLLDNFSLSRQKNAQYDAFSDQYRKVWEVAMLQTETDFFTYIERLRDNLDHWTILIAASDEYTWGLGAEGYEALESIGLRLIHDGNYRDAYVAAIDQGEVKYEAVSGRRIDHSFMLGGLSVSMSSSGWNTGSYCAIQVNGQNYARNRRGLNIVVYDNESGTVIDSVTFDTYQESKPITHGAVANFLSVYESVILA